MKKFLILLLMGPFFAGADQDASTFEKWIERQTQISTEKLLANVSPDGALPGAIIASPSKDDPPYYFHWVRDAALVTGVLVNLYERATVPREKNALMNLVLDFVKFTKINQRHSGLNGLGEPKYNVDATPYTGPWGRPQNDGPALRASVMIRIGRNLLDAGYEEYFRLNLWPVIEMDLRYVAREWMNPNFDLWEEVKGDHFYTRIVQRKALLDGAEMAREMGELSLSLQLKTQADLLEARLHEHVFNGEIIENLNRADGVWYKTSGLDAATLLALLHTKSRLWVRLDDPIVIRTLTELERRFDKIYAINSRYADLGKAIGRYPEDTYYGGNPWFLTTLAFAEWHYERAALKLKEGRKTEGRDLLVKGDSYLRRVRFHMDQRTGSMSEQMRREDGFMVSAHDLTWSYAAWLTAAWAREKARKLH